MAGRNPWATYIGAEGVDVDRELRVVFEVGLPEVLVAADDAGVVDHDVDASELVEDRGDGVGDGIGVGDVDDVAADLDVGTVGQRPSAARRAWR